MVAPDLHAEHIADFERKSSLYASAVSLGLIVLVLGICVLLGYSAKTLVEASAAGGSAGVLPQATRINEAAVPMRLTIRLPDVQHKLLSQVRTEASPVIPQYATESLPEKDLRKKTEPVKPVEAVKKPVKAVTDKKAEQTRKKKKPVETRKKPRIAAAASLTDRTSQTETDDKQGDATSISAGTGHGEGNHPGSGSGSAEGTSSGGVGKASKHGRIVSELHEIVEKNKRYPKQARRLGDEGTVTIRFILNNEGAITACTVEKSSGSTLLDKATRELGASLVGRVVSSAKGFGGLRISTPVRYVLK